MFLINLNSYKHIDRKKLQYYIKVKVANHLWLKFIAIVFSNKFFNSRNHS